ncbi:AMP-binding protein [Desulforhopalus sp. 52FAK]
MRTYNVYDMFVRNSNLSSNCIALSDADNSFTFGQLHDQVRRVAQNLQENGIGKGDRVAVLCMNQVEFFVLIGAVAKIGAIVVPLNWRLSQQELSYIISDSSPKILFADTVHLERAAELKEKNNITLVPLSILLTGDIDQSKITSNLQQSGAIEGDTPFCIIYTAAVEGYPRGAVLSQSNIIAANMQVIASLGLNDTDVNLNMLPLFHITGLNLALAVFQAGGKNIIIEKFDEQKTLELTFIHKVTVWGSFPPILSRIIDQLEEDRYDISSLQYIVGLDGPEPISKIEELCGAKFWILYGQSETSGFVTFGEASEKSGSAGKQGCLTKYCLLDENDEEVEDGTVGEIGVQGPLVFQGYWNLEAVNKNVFRNGWHHTGDLGQRDEDGYLYFKGRKPEKDLIKPGGENVYPAEVEAVILDHQSIKAVCVIGVPDPKFGEGIKAVCVLEENCLLDKNELIEFVGGRIARYKKPRYIEFVKSLPQAGDAIDRKKVKELWG